MASTEVERKFLARFAKNIREDNPILSSHLSIVLGNINRISPYVLKARKLRRLDVTRTTESTDLYCRITWLARVAITELEGYIIPYVQKLSELKTLAHKLRASYYHILVLFANNPPISLKGVQVRTPPGLKPPRNKLDKGKGIDHSDADPFRPGSVQPTHELEGGPVGGAESEHFTQFLGVFEDFRIPTLKFFHDTCEIAEKNLWGSHPLRLSAKVEMCAYLYDCMHNREESRRLAKRTISEVYNAQEAMDDDMFEDAAELVSILGKMVKRGLGSSTTAGSGSVASKHAPPPSSTVPMINPI